MATDTRPLAQQLSRPHAPPRWASALDPPHIRVQFLAERHALVVPVRVQTGPPAAITLAGADASSPVMLQAFKRQTGWFSLELPPQAPDATHILVMGWQRVSAVRGSGGLPFSGTVLESSADRSLPVHELQQAISALLARDASMLQGCLLPMPAPDHLPPPGSHLEMGGAGVLKRRVDDNKPLLYSATAFVFASCQYPAGVFDRPMAGRSFDRLDRAMTSTKQAAPAALLLLGDQIYADATFGIFDPSDSVDRYQRQYSLWQTAFSHREALSRLQIRGEVHVTPDDHEISDNWEPGAEPDSHWQAAVEEALTSFSTMRPGESPPRQADGGFWGLVDIGGGHQAFMLDARITRERRPWGPDSGGSASAHIVSTAQRQALADWLRNAAAADGEGPMRPKIISSSVWVLPRMAGRAGADDMQDPSTALSDAWDGYPASLRWLLGLIATERICGVVVVCGDAHLAGHTLATLTAGGHSTALHILHAPALYAPFPFANGQPQGYRCHDALSWTDPAAGMPVHCEVRSDLRSLGDGFVRVELHPGEGGWHITACMDTDPEPWVIGAWRVG